MLSNRNNGPQCIVAYITALTDALGRFRSLQELHNCKLDNEQGSQMVSQPENHSKIKSVRMHNRWWHSPEVSSSIKCDLGSNRGYKEASLLHVLTRHTDELKRETPFQG